MDAKCNIVYARYSPSVNAVAERRILTDIPETQACEYLNQNDNRPLCAYIPGLIDTDVFYRFGWLPTKAYKEEHNKVID